MNVIAFDTEWSTAARLTLERLPSDVQRGLISQLGQLVAGYTRHYRALMDHQKALNTMPHLHIPDWNIWLRLKTQYQEDELGPVLFVYELEELSSREFAYSLHEAKQLPGRLSIPDA